LPFLVGDGVDLEGFGQLTLVECEADGGGVGFAVLERALVDYRQVGNAAEGAQRLVEAGEVAVQAGKGKAVLARQGVVGEAIVERVAGDVLVGPVPAAARV
jgi:hypothetical protein